MTAADVLRAIRTLDERQGRRWAAFYGADSIDSSSFFAEIDEIDAERRRLVGYYRDRFGSLPDGITEVY